MVTDCDIVYLIQIPCAIRTRRELCSEFTLDGTKRLFEKQILEKPVAVEQATLNANLNKLLMHKTSQSEQ